MDCENLLVTNVQCLGPFLRIYGQQNADNMKTLRTDILSALKQPSTRVPRLTDLQNGMFCLAKYLGGQFYVRAKIVNLSNPNNIIVHLLDYGFERGTDIREIRILDPESRETEILCKFSCQAIPFILSGIYFEWQQQDIIDISQMICNQLVKIKVLMRMSHLNFIQIIWQNCSLSDFLINERKLGTEISIENQQEAFFRILSKPTVHNKSISNKPNTIPGNVQMIRPVHGAFTPILGNSMVNFPRSVNVRNERIEDCNYNYKQNTKNQTFNYNESQSNGNTSSPEHKNHRGIYSLNMSPPKPTVATFKSNTLMVGQIYDVYCCIVENGPCLFSVHLKTQANYLDDMMSELEISQLKNITERPSIGMACIARFSEDRQLYRAVIMSIKPTSCQVAYVDYGNTENVSFPDLYEIPRKFLENKIFAIRFALSGYKDLEPIDDALKLTFKDMVFQKDLKLKVMPLEGPPLVQYCELYDGNTNILESLKLKKNKKLTYGPHDLIDNNNVVVIRYVESPKTFFVQNVGNIPLFEQMMDELFLHCRKSKTLSNFVKGSACAVKFENAWYRAEIINDNGKRILIRQIDFGNERNVDRNQLCIISEKLAKFPPQAIPCCLKGFEKAEMLSESATTQLEMLAETADNDRRHFKCQIFDYLSNGSALVNLIDDTIRPELNLMKRLYKLSMPLEKYLGLEKTGTQSQNTPNVAIKSNPEPMPTKHSKKQSSPLYSTVNNEDDNVILANSDWDAASSGSSDVRDTVVSPSSSSNASRKRHESNSKNFKDQYKRDNLHSYKVKDNIPPRFQKQKHEKSPRPKESSSYNQHMQPGRQRNHSSDTSGKYSQSTKGSRRNDNRNISISSGSSDATLDIAEYLPYDCDFPNDSVEPGSSHDVTICWWLSPHQFYVHIKSRISEFENMMRKLQIFYKNKSPVDISPQLQSNIIARYREDGMLYRARIVGVNPTLRKYKVTFVDFGNQSTVEEGDIWAVEKRFANLPIMSYYCSFPNIVSSTDHKYISSQIGKYLGTSSNLHCQFFRKINDVYIVDVSVNSNSLRDYLVNDRLICLLPEAIDITLLAKQQIKAKICYVKDLLNFLIEIEGCDVKLMCSYNDVKFVRSNPYLSPEFKKNYEWKLCIVDVVDVSKDKILMLQPIIPLSTNDLITKICDYPLIIRNFNIKVCYVKSENIMFVHNASMENTIADMLHTLYEFYEENGQVLDELQEGIVCVAKSSDGNWYRVRISSVDPTTESCEVDHLDYGSSERISNKNYLKRIENKFSEISALALRIVLPLKPLNGQLNDSSVITEIDELTNGFMLSLSILERYKNHWIADISSNDYSLINVLQDKSLVEGFDVEFAKNIIDNEENTAAAITTLGNDSIKLIVVPEENRNTLEAEDDNTKISTSDECELQSTLEFDYQEHINNEEAKNNNITADISKETEQHNEPTIINEPDEYADDNENMIPAYLSHCDNPGRFFIQLASTSVEVKKLQDNLQIVAGSLPPLMNYVDGAMCIALYSADESWYRARILDSEIMVIQFIDYGNTDVVTDNSYLKEMNEAFADVPPLAIPCALPIAPKDTIDWVDTANDIFYNAYEKTVYFEYISKSDKKNYVRLKVDNFDVAEQLISQNMARQLQVVKSGEKCYVSHINSLSDFYIQMATASNGLELIAMHLTDFENFPIFKNPPIGAICAAIFPEDKEWYRAKVLSNVGGEIEILFIDFGNTATATEIRKISPKIASLPPLSKKCSLYMPDHILGWSGAAEVKFAELAAMGETVFTTNLMEPGEHAIVELFIEENENILTALEPLCDRHPLQVDRKAKQKSETENVDEKEINTNQETEKTKKVFLSHINGPYDFYVQLESDQVHLDTIRTGLLKVSDFTKLVPTACNAGDLCIATFKDDGAFYRAQIVSTCKDGCEILFVDLGIKSFSENVCILPDELKFIGGLAKHCSLKKNDEPDDNYQLTRDNFNSLITEHFGETFEIEIIEENNNLWIVKLFHDKIDLGEILAELVQDEKNSSIEQPDMWNALKTSSSNNEVNVSNDISEYRTSISSSECVRDHVKSNLKGFKEGDKCKSEELLHSICDNDSESTAKTEKILLSDSIGSELWNSLSSIGITSRIKNKETSSSVSNIFDECESTKSKDTTKSTPNIANACVQSVSRDDHLL